MPFDCWKSFKSFGNVQMFKDIGVAHSVLCCLFVLCFTIPALSELSELTLTLKHKWVCANQFSICMLPLKYVHALNWACAGFQLSMCILPVEHMQALTFSLWTLLVEHMHAYRWACVYQLSVCITTLQHAHTLSWECEHFKLSMCILLDEHVHTSRCAYACLNFSMWMLVFENLHAYIWAWSHFQVSMCTLAFCNNVTALHCIMLHLILILQFKKVKK